MNKSWLYIPIETKVRELHGKTLLACFAAINKFNVVIGSKKDIHARVSFLPKGIVFSIGLAKNLAKNARKYKEYGHKVASIDEEGIVTLNDDLYLRHRVSKEALGVTDFFFCWGKRQASLIKKKLSGTNCKEYITGNPRFDMLRPEYREIFKKDAEKIKQRYGNFILVNTNFGHGNHFAGDEYLLDSFKEKGWMDNPEDKKFFLANIKWQKRMFKEFKIIIPILSREFKDVNIIIRPHPSENHEVWKKFENKFTNVFVIHSGNVIPWLMATDVLVHNGCTTAIEAYLLGSAVISYRPFIEEEQETELPNKISLEVTDIHKLIKSIKKSSPPQQKDIEDYLKKFLSGYYGKTASEKIAITLKGKIAPQNDKIEKAALVRFDILEYAAAFVRRIALKKDKGSLSVKYQLHKTPGLTKKDFAGVLESFSRIDKRFKKLRIKRIGKSLYQIYEK